MKKIFFRKGYLIGSLLMVMLCTFACKDKYDFNGNNMNTTDLNNDISPNETEVSYDVTEFEGLNFDCAMRITVSQDAKYSLKIKGDPIDIQDLKIAVNSNTLEINYQQDRKKRYRMTAVLTVPVLKKINFKGTITSVFNGFEDTKNWSLKLAGVSTTKMNLNAEVLDAQIIGTSAAKLLGVCSKITATVEGVSSMNGSELSSKNTTLNVSGTSNASIRVSDKLKVTAKGVSSVYYYGDPTTDIEMDGLCVVKKK